jgi:hypothetical protein
VASCLAAKDCYPTVTLLGYLEKTLKKRLSKNWRNSTIYTRVNDGKTQSSKISKQKTS